MSGQAPTAPSEPIFTSIAAVPPGRGPPADPDPVYDGRGVAEPDVSEVEPQPIVEEQVGAWLNSYLVATGHAADDDDAEGPAEDGSSDAPVVDEAPAGVGPSLHRPTGCCCGGPRGPCWPAGHRSPGAASRCAQDRPRHRHRPEPLEEEHHRSLAELAGLSPPEPSPDTWLPAVPPPPQPRLEPPVDTVVTSIPEPGGSPSPAPSPSRWPSPSPSSSRRSSNLRRHRTGGGSTTSRSRPVEPSRSTSRRRPTPDPPAVVEASRPRAGSPTSRSRRPMRRAGGEADPGRAPTVDPGRRRSPRSTRRGPTPAPVEETTPATAVEEATRSPRSRSRPRTRPRKRRWRRRPTLLPRTAPTTVTGPRQGGRAPCRPSPCRGVRPSPSTSGCPTSRTTRRAIVVEPPSQMVAVRRRRREHDHDDPDAPRRPPSPRSSRNPNPSPTRLHRRPRGACPRSWAAGSSSRSSACSSWRPPPGTSCCATTEAGPGRLRGPARS